MITFAELETLVVEQTKRSSIKSITQAAIRTAVLRAHHVDFFPRDLTVATLPYTPVSSATHYDFQDLSSTLVRFRTLQLINCIEIASGKPVEELEYRELQDLYDSDNVRRPSIYTLIGDTLRIFPQLATGQLEAYYYTNPNVAEAGFNSWIADAHPDDIAMWAAAIVYSRTGFIEQAKQITDTQITPFKEMLLNSKLLGSVK